jgi:DNA modification methylase
MFPLIEGDEFSNFVNDIKHHGQREKALVVKGPERGELQIVDGRNRYRATQAAKQKFLYEIWDGKGSLAELACSLNLQRRHLTPSQKAAAGVAIEEQFAIEAEARRKAGKHLPANLPGGAKGEARELAARACGVSARYITDAKLVHQTDPALFAQLIGGGVTISQAMRSVRVAAKRDQAKAASRSGRVIDPENCTIIVGDCVKKMPTLPRRTFRLAFWDPPYNLGFNYFDDPTRDRLKDAAYLKMIGSAIAEGAELLTPDGTLCLMICEEWVAEFKPLLLDAGLHVRRLIVWHESFGQNGKSNFGKTCRYIWYAVKDPDNYVFDAASILTESKRASIYNDKRAMPGGKVPDALWDFSRLAGTFKERIPDKGIPTQLPVELVKRAVRCFTEIGDHVLDAFGGTGTTARAALQCGRKCTLIERSPRYAEIIRRELTRDNEGKG